MQASQHLQQSPGQYSSVAVAAVGQNGRVVEVAETVHNAVIDAVDARCAVVDHGGVVVAWDHPGYAKHEEVLLSTVRKQRIPEPAHTAAAVLLQSKSAEPELARDPGSAAVEPVFDQSGADHRFECP